MQSFFIKQVILIIVSIHLTASLDNGLGLTPPMGWNTWNHYNCQINEDIIKQNAHALIDSGLAAKGYKYVNLDDCWQISRDNVTGKIQEDKTKFPSGIKALADYIHNLNLYLGIYSDAGTMTCQKRPGSLGHEVIDAQTYADWGIDYLKYDNCNNKWIPPMFRYPQMRDALNKTGRPIYFSMCEWGQYFPWFWAQNIANSWRTTPDISDNWFSFLAILEANSYLHSFAKKGAWNDPDMLEVGNGGMTTNEYQTHFAFWAFLKAPLIIGCDITNMTQDTFNILSNEDIIAINQDPLGIQGKRVYVSQGDMKERYEIWAGPLQNDQVAVILFNREQNPGINIQFNFKDVGLKTIYAEIRDLITKEDIGVHGKSYEKFVPGRSVAMFKLKPYPQ